MATNYFVTGGTGFIGRFLIPKLLDRGGRVHMLVREASMAKVEDLRALWGVDDQQLVAVSGDLGQKRLGVSAAEIRQLKDSVDHFVHLAAIYDLNADADSQRRANVEGTREALACARALDAGCFHHVSSIAAAGLYPGTFTEEMFEEAEGLDHPYYRTKHDSEGLVRRQRKLPWRVYRPGIVVGDSASGEMDKIDGPYYFFPAIRSISRTLPSWLRSLALKGGLLNIVPVDYVAASMDYLMHLDGHDGEAFLLTHETGISVGEVLAELLRVAHGPHLSVIRSGLLDSVAARMPVADLTALPVVKRALEKYGIPGDALRFASYPTRFDSTHTRALLAHANIECPDFEDYAPILWQYWEDHMREVKPSTVSRSSWEDAFKRMISSHSPAKLKKVAKGKVVVVTGASSGIGHECALKLATAGATVILAARNPDKLDQTVREISAIGGVAKAYPCDISDMQDCDRFVARVLAEHGRVDVLINNAGRSIRRSVNHSFDRFHDFERTMQLNYFGALRLIMGFVPGMLERGNGHIINISSIGVLASPPRFSAYVASKAALDAFSWCAASEFADRDVRFTTVNMPLVRTPMIAPTRLYDAFPTLTPDEASDLVMQAVVERPKRVATGLGLAGAVAQAVTPRLSEFILNQAYRLFPDSAAAQGLDDKTEDVPNNGVELARRMFSQVFSGVHW